MQYYHSKSDNKLSIDIDTIVLAFEEDYSMHYYIKFTTTTGSNPKWLYTSKFSRDAELAEIRELKKNKQEK